MCYYCFVPLINCNNKLYSKSWFMHITVDNISPSFCNIDIHTWHLITIKLLPMYMYIWKPCTSNKSRDHFKHCNINHQCLLQYLNHNNKGKPENITDIHVPCNKHEVNVITRIHRVYRVPAMYHTTHYTTPWLPQGTAQSADHSKPISHNQCHNTAPH